MSFLTTLMASVLLALLQEDVACIGGGLYLAVGDGSLLAVILGCGIGTTIGDTAWIFLGRKLGPQAVRRAPLRWIMRDHHVDRGRQWMTGRASSLIFISRFLPGFRTPLHLALGMSTVPLRRMFPLIVIAAFTYISLLAAVSTLLATTATRYAALREIPAPLLLLVAGLLVFAIVRLVQRFVGAKVWRLVERPKSTADSSAI